MTFTELMRAAAFFSKEPLALDRATCLENLSTRGIRIDPQDDQLYQWDADTHSYGALAGLSDCVRLLTTKNPEQPSSLGLREEPTQSELAAEQRGLLELALNMALERRTQLEKELKSANAAISAWRRTLGLPAEALPQPDIWVSSQHGELVAVPGYSDPDITVYKRWVAANYASDQFFKTTD